MTKSDLVALVAEKTGTTKVKTKEVIDATIEAIKQCDGITFEKFGRFERSKRTFNCNLKGNVGKKTDVEKLVFRSKVRY